MPDLRVEIAAREWEVSHAASDRMDTFCRHVLLTKRDTHRGNRRPLHTHYMTPILYETRSMVRELTALRMVGDGGSWMAVESLGGDWRVI